MAGIGKAKQHLFSWQMVSDWYECDIVPEECEGGSLHPQRKQGRVSV